MSGATTAAVYDVAIVGGGPAGCGAALAAAARGAHCLLIDRGPRLGGNVGNAFVHTICGLYLPVGDEDASGAPAYASPGLASRFARELAGCDAAGEVERAGKVYVLPTDPRRVARVFGEALAHTGDIELLLGTEVVGLTNETANGLHQLALSGPCSGAVLARFVIDTSGDANAAALLGADFELEDAARLQNPSYIVCLRGVEPGATQGFARMQNSVAVAGAARKGELPRGCESLVFRPGRHPGEAFVTLNLRKPDTFDPLDSTQRDALACSARADLDALVGFLRSEREGFENAKVAEFAERIGVREGRRVRGRERIEADHVLDGRKLPGEVARGCWPIELWHGHERASFEDVAGACSVPLDALISRSHARLGAAGRCLSASHEALGSLRVIGTALATGEAIGTAAAFAANADRALHEVEARLVRESIAAHADEALLA